MSPWDFTIMGQAETLYNNVGDAYVWATTPIGQTPTPAPSTAGDPGLWASLGLPNPSDELNKLELGGIVLAIVGVGAVAYSLPEVRKSLPSLAKFGRVRVG